jgi:hypothetical protein
LDRSGAVSSENAEISGSGAEDQSHQRHETGASRHDKAQRAIMELAASVG